MDKRAKQETDEQNHEKSKPSKDDLFIAKVGIITGLNRESAISDHTAMEKIGWLVDEYLQEDNPVDVLRRVFGVGKKPEG